MNAPTPETDAQNLDGLVSTALGRKLERERNEARSQLAGYTSKAILTSSGTLVCSPSVGTAFNDIRDECEKLRKVCEAVSTHYSGSLDHQPFYVKFCREVLSEREKGK